MMIPAFLYFLWAYNRKSNILFGTIGFLGDLYMKISLKLLYAVKMLVFF